MTPRRAWQIITLIIRLFSYSAILMMITFSGSSGPAFAAGPPHFSVIMNNELVHGYDWPLGSVTLEIDDPSNGVGVDYTDTQPSVVSPWDALTNWVEFDLGGAFVVEPGHIVTLTDGITPKTHTVTDLVVLSVDPVTDEVVGTATPSSQVDAWIGGETGTNLTTYADSFGDWLIDYTSTYDIGLGDTVYVNQPDPDGDSTRYDWEVPNPIIQAEIVYDFVYGWDWELGNTVHLCIDSSGFAADPTNPAQCDLYYDSMTAYEEPWDPGNGRVDFNMSGSLDMQAGQYIAMTDGVTTKQHIVMNLTVTGADAASDTVFGTSDPGVQVRTWPHDCWECGVWVFADGSGDWLADYTSYYDLVLGTDGAATIHDFDGDRTYADWRVPHPRIEAQSDDEDIVGFEWPEAATLHLCIASGGFALDPTDPGQCDLFYDTDVVPAPDPGSWTELEFDFSGIYDLQAGDYISLTDGTTTKEHQVTDLAITNVDPMTDEVWGTAAPGSDVTVRAYDCGFDVTVAADGGGDWLADLTPCDLQPGYEGDARQFDLDDDYTLNSWRVPEPRLDALPFFESVDVYDWPEGATVNLTIDDDGNPGNGVLYTDSAIMEIPPWNPMMTYASFDLGGVFDLQAGHDVTVTDGITSKDHVVTSLTLTDVDADADTVSGTADPGTNVHVWPYECGSCGETVVADGFGDWLADFSGSFDLVAGTDGAAVQSDVDRDRTYVDWRVPNPRIQAMPDNDQVQGWEWPDGATVHLCIASSGFAADPTNPAQCDLYYDTGTVEIPEWDPNTTWVDFWLQGTFDVQAGQYVSMTDTVTLKEHRVTPLEVTDFDVGLDTVSGTADPGSEVEVRPEDAWHCGVTEIADGSGDWTADFSGCFDLELGSSGWASQADGDDDETYLDWRVPHPRVFVLPDDDIVEGIDFELGATLTLIIDDDGNPLNGVLYTTTTTVFDPNLGFFVTYGRFFLAGVFDIQPGHYMTLDDGTTTKTTVVTALEITGIDPDTDMVYGTSDSLDDLYVVVDMRFGEGLGVSPDGMGNWAADFSGSIDFYEGAELLVQQIDVDSDNTTVIEMADVPGWERVNLAGFLIRGTDIVSSLQSFNGDLYAAGYNPDYGASLWKMTNSWQEITTDWFGNPSNTGVDRMLEFNGQLYAGTWADDVNGGELWRSSDGTTWSQVVSSGFGDTTNGEICELIEFGGQLYAATWSWTASHGTEIWRSSTGNAGEWSRVVSNGFGDADNAAAVVMAVHNGYLYAGTGNATLGGGVWRSASGSTGTWSQVNAAGFGDAGNAYVSGLEVFDGKLYAITHHTDGAGAEIWRCSTCNGGDWEQVIDDGMGNPGDRGMPALEVVGDSLVAVVGNYNDGLVVWRTLNGNDWDVISYSGFGDGDNTRPMWDYSVVEHDGHLYVGTINFDDGGEIWRWLDVPHIQAVPFYDEVQGWEWPNAETVHLCIASSGFAADPTNPAQCDLYYDSGTMAIPPWDPATTWVNFGLSGSFDVQAGQYISMTDGVDTKEHLVTNLEVTDADPATDIVSGTADPGTAVRVWPHDCWECDRNVSANGSGDWSADFTSSFDLVAGTDGAATQTDSDEDQTWVEWRVPNPIIQAMPDNDEVQGWEWPESATVHLCIASAGFAADPTNPAQCDLYYDTGTVEIPEWDPFTTWVNFWLYGTFDVQAGQYISMTDTVTLKEHQVTNLAVTDFDVGLDTVTGTADPGSEVDVWPHDAWECGVTEVVDGFGDWTADFSGCFDLDLGSNGAAVQRDGDDDETYIDWFVPDPRVFVLPDDDIVEGIDFELGATLTLTIDDDGNPLNGVLYTATTTPYDPGPGPFITYGRYFLAGVFDILAGHDVTLEDGTTTKATVVTALQITEIDPGADMVYGSSDSLDDLYVVVDMGFGEGLDVSPGGPGDWSADFSGLIDIYEGAEVLVQQIDAEGDNTTVIEMAEVPGWERVNLAGFLVPGTQLVSSLQTFNGELYAAGYNPNFGASLWKLTNSWQEITTDWFGNSQNEAVDRMYEFNGQLYAGTWTDGTTGGELWRSSDGTTWTQVVANGFGDSANAEICELIEFNGQLYAATWNWTATHGAEIWRSGTGNPGSWTQVVSGGFGDPENDSIPIFKVYNGYLYAGVGNSAYWGSTSGGSVWRSSSGNPGSWSQVSPIGFGDPGNTFVSSMEEFGGMLYATTHHEEGSGGEIWRCSLCDGSDWEQVIDNGMGNPDVRALRALEIVGDSLFVAAGNYIDGLEVWRTLDGDNWSVISIPGFGDPDNNRTLWDYGVVGFEGKLYVGTLNFDDGGEIWRWLDNPWIEVHPDWDIVRGYEWQAGSTVHLCIDSSGFAADPTNPAQCDLHYDSMTSFVPSWDPYTTLVDFDLNAILNVQGGQYIAMSDGVTKKEHLVTNLALTGTDMVADTVSGTADAGTDVGLWVSDYPGVWVSTTADGLGDWVADFTGAHDLVLGSDGGAGQTDSDGDTTIVSWVITQTDSDPDVLNTALGQDDPPIDPAYAGIGNQGAFIANQLFAGLFRADDETGEPLADLAESWVVNVDATQWTITMRSDATWSDGTPLTADHVRDGILRALDPATNAVLDYTLFVIENAEDYHDGTITNPNLVGVTVLSPTQVRFDLNQSVSYLPSILSTSVARPIPSWIVSAHPTDWMEPGTIVTSGPYELGTWHHHESMLLTKSPTYYGADDVHIEQIEIAFVSDDTAWTMYQDDLLDTVYVPEVEWVAATVDPILQYEVDSGIRTCTYYYGFNTSKAPFDNDLVRKAFAAAVDRQGVIDDVLEYAQQTTQTFSSPGVHGYIHGPSEGIGIDLDVSQAQTWLSLAGYPGGVGLPPITLGYNANPGNEAIAQYIRQNWIDHLGVTVTLEDRAWFDYLDWLDSDAPQIWRLGWCSDHFDAHNFLYDAVIPRSASYGGWSNATYNTYLSDAAEIEDLVTRALLYKEAERILVETDAVTLPIYNHAYGFATKPDLIRTFGGGGYGGRVADWYFMHQCKTLTTGIGAGQGAVEVLTPENCPGGYFAGTVVDLQANPDPGWRFDFWTGAYNNFVNPTTVTMNADTWVYAFFIPTAPVDFDADGVSDIVIFRSGAWRFFDYPTASFDHGVWTGTAAGCIPAPMDYDGDGGVEPTQLCGGAWHFYNDNGSYNKGIWTGGVAGDLPVPADYDGDGTDDVVVWRSGAWRFFDFATGAFDHGVWTGMPPHWLGGTSIPVPMDYDGDGAAEFTVWSGGPWHFYNDNGSYNKGIWTGGVVDDMPVPADYDGDGTEEIVVWRSGAWRFFDFATGAFDHGVWTGSPPHWLGGTSLPSPLDYDGDGDVDFTVFSGGPWHFYADLGSYAKGIWTGGVAGDLPISRRLLP